MSLCPRRGPGGPWRYWLGVALGMSLAILARAVPARMDPRPNIVLIFADDLGYSDLGCYGGEIDTPNLDRLAANGLRFSQFYNAARCCPSRASLITGLYPTRTGVGHMANDFGLPGYRGELARNVPTIAEVLRSAGYGTYMVGKWHLVLPRNQKPGGDRSAWPNQRGFDRYYGTLPGTSSFWDPVMLVEDNEPIRAVGDDYFYTDALAQKAARYIDDATRSAEPFFLYVSFTAPHYPLHARPERIAKYEHRFESGWDALRQARYERLLQRGLISRGTTLSPRDETSPAWTDHPHREWEAHRMAAYAAMVDELDESVGHIVHKLEERGVLDHTLILFLSDNGATAEAHPEGKIQRTGKPWNDSGTRAQTRDGATVRLGEFVGQPLGPASTFGSYGAAWANLSNTPFRRFKSWVHEGGIATPLIAHWPKRIRSGGAITAEYGHIVDLMPTFLELARTAYPSGASEGTLTLDGHSLVPIFDGHARTPQPYYWEHEGNRAIRIGRWKLVSEYPGEWATLRSYPKRGAWELYDLETDRTEMHDLAAAEPAKARELAARYEAWAKQAGVLPWSEIEQHLARRAAPSSVR